MKIIKIYYLKILYFLFFYEKQKIILKNGSETPLSDYLIIFPKK